MLPCSGETRHCSPKLSLHVCCPSFISPANYSVWCICNLRWWGIITSVLLRGARSPCQLIQYQCAHHSFSEQSTFQCIISFAPLGHSAKWELTLPLYRRKNWGWWQLTICPASQVEETEFEFGSSDNMTLPWGKKFRNKREQRWEQAKRNALEWRRRSVRQLQNYFKEKWRQIGIKLSFNYTFTSDLSLGKN